MNGSIAPRVQDWMGADPWLEGQSWGCLSRGKGSQSGEVRSVRWTISRPSCSLPARNCLGYLPAAVGEGHSLKVRDDMSKLSQHPAVLLMFENPNNDNNKVKPTWRLD